MEILKRNKILFIQTAFIGDAILCLPAIQEYKKREPLSYIAVICIPSTEELFKSSPVIDEVITFDKRGVHKSLKAFLRFSRSIKIMNFEKIYSFHRSLRTSLLVIESRVKETFGFSNSALKYAYKNLINYNPEYHEVKRNLTLVGFNSDSEEWRIIPEVVSPNSNKVESFLQENRINNFAAIAPGSIWGTKKYPAEYFIEIIKKLTSKGLQVVLIGSEADSLLCNSLIVNNKTYSAAGLFSLSESVELLRRSKLLISNDSAPAHLGICAKIPVLMVYCSTIPAFGFFPYGEKCTWVSYEDLECKPCGIHGYIKCPLGHFKCGYELKPKQIIDILEEKFL